MIRLGEPGTRLADRVEPLFLAIETARGTNQFGLTPWLLASAQVTSRANALMTADIELNLADPSVFSGTPGAELYDWLIRGVAQVMWRPDEYLLGARRLRVTTARAPASDDWVLFQGYIEKIELSWSGSARKNPRGLRVYAVSELVAADREASQQMWGQWRRHWRSEKALRDAGAPGSGSNACVRIGLPLVFNPHGRPNCHPDPLVFGAQHVYIPCDADRPDAIPWTVAKVLRYLQWAALQPAPPEPSGSGAGRERYDQLYESLPRGPADPEAVWTSLGLRHTNLDALLDRDLGGKALIDHPPLGGSEDPAVEALLRALPSLSCDGMSTLEAFAYVCDRAGMAWHSYHAHATVGDVRTFLSFTIRGHYHQAVPVPMPGTQNQAPDLPSIEPGENGAVAHLNDIWVPRDKFDTTGKTETDLVRLTQATEGAILLDQSARRQSVRALGSPALYEVTVRLLPGWRPDAWWDIDPQNQAAVSAAVTRTLTSAWEQRHLSTVSNPDLMRIGRYWVLNEDGAFTPDLYKRVYGPWKEEQDWDPYPFHGDPGLQIVGLDDLAGRTNRGWSTRRRRFHEPAATDSKAIPGADVLKVGPLLLVSFNGDGGPWFTNPCDLRLEHDRCAITILNPDLRLIRGYSPETGLTDDNFVTAYIRGQLRLWITALIEGDDAVFGHARAGTGGPALPWYELLDRRGHSKATIRSQGYNALWGGGYRDPPDEDDTTELDGLARRVLSEMEIRRPTGQIVIPYLLEPRDSTPWPNYQIGDEIAAIQTGNAFSTINLLSGPPGRQRGPRVAGIVWRYSCDPVEMSTTLQLEDAMYDLDDVAGPPVRRKEH